MKWRLTWFFHNMMDLADTQLLPIVDSLPCVTYGHIMWTLFNVALTVSWYLHGCNVAPISSNEPWILFSPFLPLLVKLNNLSSWLPPITKKQHLVFSISSSPCQNTTIWCIFALGCFLSFSFPSSSSHCLVLDTLFLFIIMVEHPCKMYKKYVVVHYPLLYHPKSVFHDH